MNSNNLIELIMDSRNYLIYGNTKWQYTGACSHIVYKCATHEGEPLKFKMVIPSDKWERFSRVFRASVGNAIFSGELKEVKCTGPCNNMWYLNGNYIQICEYSKDSNSEMQLLKLIMDTDTKNDLLNSYDYICLMNFSNDVKKHSIDLARLTSKSGIMAFSEDTNVDYASDQVWNKIFEDFN